MPTVVMLASPTEPIIHHSAPRTVLAGSFARRIIIAALANAPTTTPPMMSTRGAPRVPDACATNRVSATATIAPANDARGSSVNVSPIPTARTAPAAAPPDTPRRYGSGRGVLTDPL